MPSIRRLLVIPAVAVIAACGGNDRNEQPLDSGLSSDLALAATAQQYPPAQYMSPMEMGYATPVGYSNAPYGYTPQGVPVRQPAQAQPVYRAPAPRTTTSRAPAPAAEPVRNTKRDAVIGAAAGAVIGATTSRDKVKGAIIGAAAGGLLGGIVGHTVDVKNPPR
jgi:hypothetical protein